MSVPAGGGVDERGVIGIQEHGSLRKGEGGGGGREREKGREGEVGGEGGEGEAEREWRAQRPYLRAMIARSRRRLRNGNLRWVRSSPT
jgi:hypothetical protein